MVLSGGVDQSWKILGKFLSPTLVESKCKSCYCYTWGVCYLYLLASNLFVCSIMIFFYTEKQVTNIAAASGLLCELPGPWWQSAPECVPTAEGHPLPDQGPQRGLSPVLLQPDPGQEQRFFAVLRRVVFRIRIPGSAGSGFDIWIRIQMLNKNVKC